MENIEVDKEQFIKDMASTLNMVNYQIADLMRVKEDLEQRLVGMLPQPEDAQKKHVIGKYAITVTTGYNYSLDKEEYEAIKECVSQEFNPVKIKSVYELDKKIIKACEVYGSNNDMDLLDRFITKKAKKLHVKITSGV